MPPLSEFFGSVERFVGDLYPYRVPIGALALLVLPGVAVLVHRRGLDAALGRWASAHRSLAALVAVVTLAITLPLGYYTLSPLWIRTTLDEPSPLEVGAAPIRTASPPIALPSAATTPPAVPAPTTATAPASAPAPTGTPTSTPAPLPSATVPAATALAPTPAPTPASTLPRVLRRGALAGADAFHFGRGEVLLIEAPDGKRTLRLQDLSVRNGPDLFVYLTPQPESVANAVNLGALKATDGSFNYEVPAGIDAATLAHAVIWCRQFGVLFASAPLGPGS